MVEITQKMIDAVFADDEQRKKFENPKKAKAVCEMRLAGVIYKEIAKKSKMSEYFCMQSVRKVVRLYRIFIEGEEQSKNE